MTDKDPVKRQKLVSGFVTCADSRSIIQNDYLKLLPDFHRLSKRFQKNSAGLEEVVRIYQAVVKVGQLLGTSVFWINISLD